MKVGMKFSSYDALNAAVEDYSKESKVIFTLRDSRTFKAATKRSKRVENANPKLKYYAIRYLCVYGTKFKPSKRERREGAKQRIRKELIWRSGCRADIRVLLTRCCQYLEVVSMNEEHNHPISEVWFNRHVRSRKLNDEDREKVKKYLFLKVNKKLLLEQIRRETGKLVTMKDIQNLASTVKRETKFSMGLSGKNTSTEVTQSQQQGTSEGISNAETMSAIDLLNLIGQETILAPVNPEIQEGGCETVVVEPDIMNAGTSVSLEKNNNDSNSYEAGMDYFYEEFIPSSFEQTAIPNTPEKNSTLMATPSSSNKQRVTARPMLAHGNKIALHFDSLKEELAEHSKIMQRQCTALETMSASLQSLVEIFRKEKEHS